MKGSNTPFQNFERLSANVWYLDPYGISESNVFNGTLKTTATSPDLIILATWMGAAARHISKYINGYRLLYPSSPILLIRSDATDFVFRPRRSLIKQLQPALTVVESTWRVPSSRILLHVFSNGGCHQARLLAEMFSQKHLEPLPVHAMLFDSCPGIAKWGGALAAFTVGIPKVFLLRYILLAFVQLFLLWHYVAHHVFKVEPFLRRLRRDLNDPTLFSKAAPRMYMYSKTDRMIGYKDVQSHAADAEEKGWAVTTDMFEGSKHVGHLMVDSNRYWEDVKSVMQ